MSEKKPIKEFKEIFNLQPKQQESITPKALNHTIRSLFPFIKVSGLSIWI